MTNDEITKLYLLKGTIKGYMTGMKCELRANHRVRSIYVSAQQHRWLDGRNEVAIDALRGLNAIRREVEGIIKEAEEKEQEWQTFLSLPQ